MPPISGNIEENKLWPLFLKRWEIGKRVCINIILSMSFCFSKYLQPSTYSSCIIIHAARKILP
jgi:hypothetical protein